MPDRIIRDELLRSHRYRTLSSDTARLLFIHLLLTVDNLGNCEATSTAIGDAMHRPVDAATAAKLLSELADADLLRTYTVDGKPYLHVPRFRQRLRYIGSKHPRPPVNVECNEIKDMLSKVGLQTGYRQDAARLQPAEVKRSEEKRSEVNQERKATSRPEALGSRLPEDWKLPEEWKDWALAARPEFNPQQVVRLSIDFRDYWIAKPGKDGRKANWLATWRRWVRTTETVK